MKRGPSMERDESKSDNSRSLSPTPEKERRKPGPKPEESKWTRVVQFKAEQNQDVPIFSYEKDEKTFLEEVKEQFDQIDEEESLFITYPDLRPHEMRPSIDDYRLQEDDLAKHANDAAQLRIQFE